MLIFSWDTSARFCVSTFFHQQFQSTFLILKSQCACLVETQNLASHEQPIANPIHPKNPNIKHANKIGRRKILRLYFFTAQISTNTTFPHHPALPTYNSNGSDWHPIPSCMLYIFPCLYNITPMNVK